MRRSQALFALVSAMSWAGPLACQSLFAQPGSAFEQLEQQVQRDNARDAAGPPAPKAQGQEPGYLGIIAEDRQGAGKGINVIEAIAGGPAEKAGLKADDFITSIDGQPMHSMQDFERSLSGATAGKKLAFQITRNGKSETIEVTLGQRPPPGQRRFEQFGPIPSPENSPSTPLENRGATLGVRIATVTPDLQKSLNLPSASGALVVSVVEGSAASQAGITAGNVILSVDKQPVATQADLSRLIMQHSPGQEVTIGYYNGTTTVDRKARLGGGTPPVSPANEMPASPPGFAQPSPMMQSPLPGAGGGMPGMPGGGMPGAGGGGLGMPGMPGAGGGAGMSGMPGGPPMPNQFNGPYSSGGQGIVGERIQMLEQRVQDLERRVRELEQQLKQSPPAGQKAAPARDQQT